MNSRRSRTRLPRAGRSNRTFGTAYRPNLAPAANNIASDSITPANASTSNNSNTAAANTSNADVDYAVVALLALFAPVSAINVPFSPPKSPNYSGDSSHNGNSNSGVASPPPKTKQKKKQRQKKNAAKSLRHHHQRR
mmetsp:Transcript_23/g.71  ORF Transcript_23/g.71 Transcript_23/m.71 type:complete len:137 (+) Transcript_23:1-411(+)